MHKIEINTTQNVTIQYDLAGLNDRIFAFIIDSIIVYGSILIIWMFTAPFLAEGIQYVGYFILAPIFFLYSILFEILNNGQSIGKKALKIRVVKITGKEAELSDYLIRWVFRTIDIYSSFGSIGAIFISTSDKNQRLGDILANTTVIKEKPSMNLALTDILNISNKDNYTPVYPGVKKLKEEEMLVVKSVIERVRQYPNDAHRLALTETSLALKKRLSLDEVKEEEIEFLRTLIKDYIVLTR
jgi:uncharacterized RDD family membrane protein YckC